MWQELWPILYTQIYRLFYELIQQGKPLQAWKVAKIIPLKKPGKPDLTEPTAFRPISLLSTLSKAIEALVIEKIAYLVDKFGLFPSNHYGALKQKSTVDVFLTVQEKIYQAWKDKKVLVACDLKSAFNSVSSNILVHRLRACRVPEIYVQWIQDFFTNWSATITVNGVTSTPQNLIQAGLPQLSPLSPLLFLFFNADLVQDVIDKNRGSNSFC